MKYKILKLLYHLQKMCIANTISGLRQIFQQNLKEFKRYLIGKLIQENLKKSGMYTLIKNLQGVKKGIGFVTKVMTLILLALIICTCSGPRLMLGDQNLGKQIDYSLFSGRHVRQIQDATEFVTSKIDGLDLALCHRLKQLTKLPSHQIVDLGYYQRLEQMQKNVYRQSCTYINPLPIFL